MATTQGTKFPTTLVTEMFSKVKGHSSVAKMIPAQPIPFNGNTEFTFSMDKKLAVVIEKRKCMGVSSIGKVIIAEHGCGLLLL